MDVGKTCGDQYRDARLAAARANESLSTYAGAAEALGVSAPETIGRWERDETTPSNLNVKRMAQVYGAPELMHNYCAMQCPIGIGRVQPILQRNLEQIAIRLFGESSNAETDVREVLLMAEDGKISADEIEEFRRIVARLGGLKNAIELLQIYAEKLDREANMP